MNGEFLVAERWRGRDPDEVEFVLCRAVTVITGIGQQQEGGTETRQVLRRDGLADAIHRRKDHRDRDNLGAVGAKALDIVERLPDLADLEIGQFPVLCRTGKPQLFVMHLDAGHELAQTGTIAIAQPVLQAIHLHLEGGVVGSGLAAGGEQQGCRYGKGEAGWKPHA